MLVDFLQPWIQHAKLWILSLYALIFPEYPTIGIAVFISALVFFIYFLCKGEPKVAFKMALSTITGLSFILYSLHWLIKLWHALR
jgi:hypothetical protein